MNKRQKIVQQQFLNNEEAVIKRLKQVYNQSLKDINTKAQELQNQINALQQASDIAQDENEKAQLQSMIQSKVYQKQYQDALKKQIGSILDNMQVEEFKTVSEYLQKCYEDGFMGTLYDLQGQGIPLCFPLDQEAMVRAVQLDSKISKGLYTRLGEDIALLKKKITAQVSRGISTGMSYQQIAQQLAGQTNIGYNNAIRIARTEGGRIRNQSAYDAALKAKEAGADIVLQWDAALDKRTRSSHQRIDGEIVELGEKFSNGLLFPCDPNGAAAEVINCRCAALQRARWALDEDELQTLKDRAEYFGLDKADTFDDYKKKYLKAASDETLMTRADMKQRIKDDKKRIDQINDDIREIDRKIDKHSSHDFDDFDGLKKDEISDRIKAIEDRLEQINPISEKWYNRPERGTDEYTAWREWRRSIDFPAIQDEQFQLAQEKADLSSILRRWDDYEEWLQWKKDNPLDVLKTQKASFLNEIEKLKQEIDNFDEQLSKMAIPSDWKQITGAHTSEMDIKASNPHYSEGYEYRVNCQRCVPTYEMRRRGYDVIAKPRITSGKDETADKWTDIFNNAKWIRCNSGSGVQQIQKQMKAWGDGARAEVYVAWKGGGSAHVFVAEQVDGKTVFIDPQPGSMDCKDYFKHVRSGYTMVCRIDNLNPSELIAECCEGVVSK